MKDAQSYIPGVTQVKLPELFSGNRDYLHNEDFHTQN